MTYYFFKVQIEAEFEIGCMDQVGRVHGVGDLATFSHFKTTF